MTDTGFTKETTPGEGVREFYRRQGEKRFTDRAITLLTAKQCFGYIQKAACEHSACYTVQDIIQAFTEGKK